MSARHGIEGGVDGFVREAHRFVHTTECARNLLRTQALAQVSYDLLKERAAYHQLAHHAGLCGERAGPLLGRHGAIAASYPRTPTQHYQRLGYPAVARHLAGDRRARPLEQRTLLKRQLLIRLPHATLSLSEMLHLDFERGLPCHSAMIPQPSSFGQFAEDNLPSSHNRNSRRREPLLISGL